MTDKDIELLKSFQKLYDHKYIIPWSVLLDSTGINRHYKADIVINNRRLLSINYEYNGKNIQKTSEHISDMEMIEYFWNDDMRAKLQKYLFQQI